MVQLYIKDSRLQLVDTGIAPLEFVYILLPATVISQCCHCLSQLFVIGSNSSRITQCPKVFAWIEAMASCIAQSSRPAPVECTTMSLGIVFY